MSDNNEIPQTAKEWFEQGGLPEPEFAHEPDWYYDGDDDEYQNEMESAQDNCGLDENDWCWNSGTEHCSFFCPFREIFQNADSFPFSDDSDDDETDYGNTVYFGLED